MNSQIIFTLGCTGAPIITYAMLGENKNNVKLVDFPCGSSVTA